MMADMSVAGTRAGAMDGRTEPATRNNVPVPAAARTPAQARSHPIPRGELAATDNASTGRTLAALRPARYAATWLTSSTAATAAAGGQTLAVTSKVPGSSPLSRIAPASRPASQNPGHTPTRAPTRVTVLVSRERRRRTCRGCAPTALRRAISRCRCWTNRVIMPASTRAATNSAMPPREPLIAIRRRLESDASRNSAFPRSPPVSTTCSVPTTSSTEAATVSMSVPSATVTASRSTRSEEG